MLAFLIFARAVIDNYFLLGLLATCRLTSNILLSPMTSSQPCSVSMVTAGCIILPFDYPSIVYSEKYLFLLWCSVPLSRHGPTLYYTSQYQQARSFFCFRKMTFGIIDFCWTEFYFIDKLFYRKTKMNSVGASHRPNRSLGIIRDKTYLLNEYKDGINSRRNNRFDGNRYIWFLINHDRLMVNKNLRSKTESFLSSNSTDESTTIELCTTSETPEYVLIYDNTMSLLQDFESKSKAPTDWAWNLKNY